MANVRKAVLITDGNKKELSARFRDSDESGIPLSVGYYLLTDFDSQDRDYSIVTPGLLLSEYNKIRELENGFIEVRRKVSQ